MAGSIEKYLDKDFSKPIEYSPRNKFVGYSFMNKD
jgi:hypothetical protein